MSTRNAGPNETSEPAFEQSCKPVRITRRFCVKFEGSLNLIDQLGPMSATWSPSENTHATMFGANMEMEDTDTLHAISNAVIVNCKLLESKSTFPVSLGLSCNVIPGQEVTEYGERYLTTILPQSTQNEAQIVYEADPEARMGLEWRTSYPRYTKLNLEEEGTMEVKNCAYLFVSQSHPVIDVLKENGDVITNDICEQTLIDGEWFKIDRPTFDAACTAIRRDVLSNVHTADLNTIQFQLHRFNSAPWNQIKNEEFCYSHDTEASKRAELVNARLNHPCSYHARVEMTYELNR